MSTGTQPGCAAFDDIERWGSAPDTSVGGLPPEAVAVNEEQEKIAYWRERALRSESECRAMAAVAPDPTPDPGDSLYEECLAVQGPEIPVTEEMKDARIAALEVEITNAHRYLEQLFLHMAPQCTPFPDLMGICTQVDNAICGLKMRINELDSPLTPTGQSRIAALEADNAGLMDYNGYIALRIVQLMRENAALRQQLATFGPQTPAEAGVFCQNMERCSFPSCDCSRFGPGALSPFGPQTPADMPDPPRRPDGTLAPEAKPWTPPRPAGDTMRVGS